MSNDIDKIIEEVIVEKEGKKYIYCGPAYELSKKYNISLKEIGEYCNEHNIKISRCQLGCF